MTALKDELGDLLFQVAFHSQIADELSAFTFGDVVEGICAKMTRRHPHVFGDAPKPDWETLKEQERSTHMEASALGGVALALPALMRAEKLQKRAARTGFDWPDQQGARDKVVEEIQEVTAETTHAGQEEEIGDLLFAVVNWARKLGVDPEIALRKANGKFETRFRAMETSAGDQFVGLTLDEKEALWQAVKRTER
jgi:ATP diphosphatase